MTNKWNIPAEMEARIRKRDDRCVYCKIKFKDNPKDEATWEHIDNNENNICEENVTLCCHSCNSSKGNKELLKWLHSSNKKKITRNSASLSEVVKNWIRMAEKK